MAYRSVLLYRNPGHYRPGVFDLTYRNSHPYPGVLTEDGPQAPFYDWDEDTTSWVEVE